jgi:hypothetical protein
MLLRYKRDSERLLHGQLFAPEMDMRKAELEINHEVEISPKCIQLVPRDMHGPSHMRGCQQITE